MSKDIVNLLDKEVINSGNNFINNIKNKKNIKRRLINSSSDFNEIDSIESFNSLINNTEWKNIIKNMYEE